MAYFLTVFGIIAGVVALDQITKLIVVKTMAVGETVDIISGVFRFTHIKNPGAAFGMLKDARWVFILFSLVGIAVLMVYLVKFKPKEKLLYIPMSMIVGGGIGNMIDRMFFGETFGNGKVVDFLDFYAFGELWTWVFNVADACVCVGAGLMMLYLVIEIIKEEKMKKAESADKAEDKAE